MAGPVPVKGSEISSAPCSVQRAAAVLRRFLSGEAALEFGIAKGYIESVAQSLEEMMARRRENSGHGAEELGLATAGRSSKFFNVEQVDEIPEVRKTKSRKDEELKESKRKEKDQAMVDFEALLGHELDGAEAGEPGNGELGFEEKPAVTEMLLSTPGKADSVEDGRESLKSQKRKKKKSKSLDEAAAMDVDMAGVQGDPAVDSDPADAKKSAKKKKKTRKSVDGVALSNGLLSSAESPAKTSKVEEGKETKKKKKQKHGATPKKEEVLTAHVHSSVGDRGKSGNGSEVQQGSAKKKSKKRASEESPVARRSTSKSAVSSELSVFPAVGRC